MNKLFTLCSAAVVLAATGASAQMSRSNQAQQQNPCLCLEQGMGLPTEKKCFPAAYNAPASISVSCGWDFDVFASFLYWYVGQDAMDVAHVAPTLGTPPLSGAVAYQNQSWKPGFQAGFGFNTNYDDWVGWVEYTWMHQSESGSTTVPNLASGLPGTWAASDWFIPAILGTSPNVVASSWKMHLDMLDAVFSRPYYQGTQLTVSPYAGLRALWIRQYMNVGLRSTTAGTASDFAHARSNSWAIGPVVGTEGHWLLGAGFRFEGNAAGALLYTQYTTLGWSQTSISGAGVVTKTVANSRDLGAVRPVLQLGAGLGYGSYLYCQKYYIDFSARYDFNFFCNQNMIRTYASQLAGYDNFVGNLYLHGLTLTGRFDF